MAESFTMSISHTPNGWHAHWTENANVGDVVTALTIGVCAASVALSTDPADVLARVNMLVECPDVHIVEKPWPEGRKPHPI